MRHLLAIAFILLFAVTSASAPDRDQTAFDAKDIAAANSLVESVQIAEWLGPMAPIALSPFFGVTVLSGLAIYGPEWATDNALLSQSGPLQNHTLFIVFLVLTILTSLPRLSKVSKPFAQALDQLETYSVIVIILAIKFLSETSPETTQVAFVQLGIFSVSINVLLSIAMIINIVVINSVKFFFEFLVWLTPVPTIDAVFEFCNKGLCAILMTVYAFSPTLATIINIVILLTAAVIFRWANRQVGFYRTMITDPLLAWIWPSYGKPNKPEIIVFCQGSIGPFAPKSRLKLSKVDDGWQLTTASWFLPSTSHSIAADARPTVHHGWVMHSIDLIDGRARSLIFSRRYDRLLTELAQQLELKMPDSEHPGNLKTHARIAGEFA